MFRIQTEFKKTIESQKLLEKVKKSVSLDKIKIFIQVWKTAVILNTP